MATDEWTPKLDAYVDGELPPAEDQLVAAHLRTCPQCAGGVIERLRLKRAVRAAADRFAPRPELLRRVERQIAPRARHNGWLAWAPAAAGIAALVLAGVLVTRVGGPGRERERVFTELADLHVAALASLHPVDVASSDRHTVKPWFEGKLPFAFNLPELSTPECALVGGRLTYVNRSPAAHLIYQIRKHAISVFVLQEHASGQALPAQWERPAGASFTLITWSAGELRYFVVGDASPDVVAPLVTALKAAAHS
jgi:anti-sigma factor RsiW